MRLQRAIRRLDVVAKIAMAERPENDAAAFVRACGIEERVKAISILLAQSIHNDEDSLPLPAFPHGRY
jgi:hypothetical protein